LQAALAEIQEQRKRADHASAALRTKEFEIERLRRVNKALEDIEKNAKSKIDALHIQIQSGEKEILDLERHRAELLRLLKAFQDVAGITTERISKESKRARESNGENALTSPKRLRTETAAVGGGEAGSPRAGTGAPSST
jgi:hypothetical protein